MKNFRSALESIDSEVTDGEGLVQEVPVKPEEAGKLIDVMEADQLQDATDERLKEAEIATESLLETYGFVKTLGSKLDYASHALVMNNIQTVARFSGVKIPTPRTVSLEAFDLNKDQQFNIALEGIGETIKNVWEKVKAFFARIYNWIRSRIGQIGQNVEKLKKARDTLEEKSKGATFKEEFSVTGYIENLIAYRKGDPIQNMASDLKATQVLLDRFVSPRGRAEAAPLIENINDTGIDISNIFGNRNKHTDFRKSVEYASESVSAVASAFDASEGTDESQRQAFIVDSIPGNLSLILRPPALDPTFEVLAVIEHVGSIRITKSKSEEYGDVPKSIDAKFVAASIRFIDITLKVMDKIEKDLEEFPSFKMNADTSRAKHIEEAANKNDGKQFNTEARLSGIWKAAATLQMFYGIWITQLTGGLLQTSFALTKFCDAGMEPAAK